MEFIRPTVTIVRTSYPEMLQEGCCYFTDVCIRIRVMFKLINFTALLAIVRKRV